MTHTPRIGLQIDHEDPFWVQVREAVWQRGRRRAGELIEVAVQEHSLLLPDEQVEAVEDLLVQEIDALICNTYPASLLERILERGIPIVYVSESPLRHPRFVSRRGLFEAGEMLGTFLRQRLARGTLLVVGGLMEGIDRGQSRLDGFAAGLGESVRLSVHHIPTPWLEEQARPYIAAWLAEHPGLTIDAIYGLSDPLALAAREVCAAVGRLGPETVVVGVNGDPLALAAIHNGLMAATVETDVEDIAGQAVELACAAARGEGLPPTFTNRQRLITAANVADRAVHKLMSLAALPSRLVGVNRRNEQQRITQREASAAIERKVGLILDEQQLSLAITALIHDSYGFDDARFLSRDPEGGLRVAVSDRALTGAAAFDPGDPAGPLAYALAQNQLVFIPDTAASHRFAPDPQLPAVRARVIVPVRLGGQLVGLLDLHRHRPAHHTRDELAGLQLLADRLAIAMRNAQLYSRELAARATAEQADRLKTTLLANVSHELRTPLNVILGYSRGALDALAGGGAPPSLAADLAQIYQGGEHLLRLINDLLDLSRAEIGELDLLPEPIALRPFLEGVFRAAAEGFGGREAVSWRLALPPALPPFEGDPVRLRQILLNLLHNAHKFTERGAIILGAEALVGELQIWVADTGPGIAPELRERVFDPFVSTDPVARRHEGIGLGLHITRRLVALHRGRLTLTSALGRGSTFSLFLPLPVQRQARPADTGPPQVLLLISDNAALPEPVVRLAERCGLALRLLRSNDNLTSTLQTIKPALLAWDVTTAADDGWRVIEAIRSRPDLRQLPVMIYNGAVDAAVDTAGAATGVLLKPLGDEALLGALSDLDPRVPDGSILIVEDDPQVRAQHRRLIAGHFPGYALRDVGDGRAALAASAARPPSLIVLDLMLPELDGFAVLEALRADRRTAGVPVLVLSGKLLTGEDIRRLSEARVTFQTKDLLSAGELAAALRRTMEQTERLPPHTSALVKQALAFMQRRYGEPLSRQTIAEAVGVNKDYLGRIFQQELGLSPWEYLIRYRVLRAKALLRETDLTVAEVAARVGFETPSYFSQAFHREVGCSPRAFRARGQA